MTIFYFQVLSPKTWCHPWWLLFSWTAHLSPESPLGCAFKSVQNLTILIIATAVTQVQATIISYLVIVTGSQLASLFLTLSSYSLLSTQWWMILLNNHRLGHFSAPNFSMVFQLKKPKAQILTVTLSMWSDPTWPQPSFLPLGTSSTLAALPFLRHVRRIFRTGPLCWLLLQHSVLPYYISMVSSLTSFIFYSKVIFTMSSLATLSKISKANFIFHRIFSCFIISS